MNGIAARVYGWLDERVDLSAVRESMRHKAVPVHRYSVLYLCGGLTLFFLGVQIVTGVLLMLYYRPSPDEAFESIEFLMTSVHYGWLVRSVHAWSAHLTIFFAFLHLVTVFFLRAFRKPREVTWITGCLLLFLLLGFGFSGSLLPWNQLAYFATKVGVSMAQWTPFVGSSIHNLLVGGERIGGATLLRFYTLHVFVLPLATIGLIAMHLYLVQHHGMSVPKTIVRRERRIPSVPFFFQFLLRDALCWIIALAALLVLAARAPAELGEKADPFAPAYDNIRPEWYFMFIFQSLRLMPPGEVLGIPLEALPFFGLNLGAFVLLAVPFLDRGPLRAREGRALPAAGAVVLAYIVGMTALGYRSLLPLTIAAATLAIVLLLLALSPPRPRGGS